MKKLLSSFAFLTLFVASARADSSVITTRNTFSFSQSVVAAAGTNPGWQIFNPSTSRKTIYIEKIDAGSDGQAKFIFYSTTTGAGFTGLKTSVTASPLDIGKTTSVSSCTYTASGASSPTGNLLWQSVALASTTINPGLDTLRIAIRPGYALYVINSNPAISTSFVDFYFREEYAP